jgi:heterodisulfide reductase subunit D
MVDEGQYPEIMDMMRKRRKESRNVSFDTNEGRTDWIKPVPDIPEDRYVKDKAEVIYFVGCVSSFSPRTFKIPRSIVQIFQKADVDFGLLGDDEWCCGFPLLSSGFSQDFVEFAEHNIKRVNKTGAKYLVTSCPSCYHMWSHTYPERTDMKMEFEVLHVVQYLYMLVQEGKLKLKKIDKKVTFHDPCDLGRNSGIYEEPRNLLKAIPGVEFVELSNSGEYATCCGGGGNVESIDAELSSNIAALKAKEIIETGAEVVTTSCQQCVRTIATALKKQKSKIKAVDLTQFILDSISTEEE